MKTIYRGLVITSYIVLTGSTQFAYSESIETAEQSACNADKLKMLERNWPTEMHLPEHTGDDLVLIWHDEGVVYTTGTEDPRVDNEGQPQLTYAQKFYLTDRFPSCNL